VLFNEYVKDLNRHLYSHESVDASTHFLPGSATQVRDRRTTSERILEMRRNLIAYAVSQLPILARDAEPISRMDISDKHSISSKDRGNYCRLQKNFLRAEFFVPLIKNVADGLKEDTPRALDV
jgi:hypothetical protein